MATSTGSYRSQQLLHSWLVGLAVIGLVSCGSPVSPDAVVMGVALPERLSGNWRGISARQVSGPAQTWSLENLLLRPDGSAEITEYEGSLRRDTGVWNIVDGDVVVIDFMSFCDRRGRGEGNTLTLTCVTSTRTWETVFIRP